jgi:hypothetical protein
MTQHLTEMSTRKYLWGVERGRHRHLGADCLDNLGSSTSDRPSRPVTELVLLFSFIYNFIATASKLFLRPLVKTQF